MHRFTLEKYKGKNTRYDCPSCKGKKEFTRYIDTYTGRHLDHQVGMCNRKANCGYHYSPREYFADNPEAKDMFREERQADREVRRTLRTQMAKPRPFDTINDAILMSTLSGKSNDLLTFLAARFGRDQAIAAAERYSVGTWKDGRTVLWQIDRAGKIRSGKLMSYDPVTGKRRKDRGLSWVHAELKKSAGPNHEGQGTEDGFELKQCYFGEHLLSQFPDKPLAIVESEKTAIIASIFFEKYNWLATGGCGNLRLDELVRLAGARPIVLFPDSTQYQKWRELIASTAAWHRRRIAVSDLLESKLTAEQKKQDLDLADLIIELHSLAESQRPA